jgi:ABC-type bacteriocin/lantibiotic exporter with double-glycine peptidase domain
VITILSDSLTLIAVLFMMFYSSWQLTPVTLTVLPLLLIWHIFSRKGSENHLRMFETRSRG